MIRVKICGLTNLADARFCAAAGADYLGFIQHPESPRYIRPEVAREIIDWLHGPETVGVFQDAPLDTVLDSVRTARFSIVQLHGDESPEYCSRIPVPVIKTFGISPSTTSESLATAIEPYRAHIAHVLLDTRVGAARGGTGMTFDWNLAVETAREWPIFLAGGLRAENVADAARLVRPFAIDLASGVEEHPLQKDYSRVSALFEALEPFREPTP